MTLDDRLRQAVREELELALSDGFRPGGGTPLRGFDPDYDTKPVRIPQNKSLDGSVVDGSESPMATGETRHFTFTLNNNVAENAVYGVIVKVPGTPAGGAFVVHGPGKDGRVRSLSCDSTKFNQAVGRFFSGAVSVEGTVENGAQPGLVQVAFGTAQTQDDLGDFSGAGGDPETAEGTEDITLSAGFWLLTINVDQAVDPLPVLGTEPPRQLLTVTGATAEMPDAELLPWTGGED